MFGLILLIWTNIAQELLGPEHNEGIHQHQITTSNTNKT